MKNRFIFSALSMLFVLVFLLVISGCEKEDQLETIPEVESSETHSNSRLKSFSSGTHDGFYWQLWTSDGLSGSVDYQNGSDGNFSVSWNCNGNYTCGKGWGTGTTSRVIGYNCGAYSHNGGGGSFAVYGWTRNPLIEYYVQEKWPGSRPSGGIGMGSITSDGATYDLRREWRENAPSIDGTQSFWQLISTRSSQASTGSNNTVTFANHANGWTNGGMSLGSNHSYQILLQEAWGNSNGYVNATVWESGAPGPGDECTLTLRASSTDGQGSVRVVVGGTTVADWTFGTSMSTRSVTLTSIQGDCYVEFYNDASGRDVQLDYLSVCGDVRQAENQSYNTATYGNGECGGGSYSEMMHCNGIIGFGSVSY
jgi:hypothetical protein